VSVNAHQRHGRDKRRVPAFRAPGKVLHSHLQGLQECRHGVLSSHIKSHLRRVHRIKHKQAEEIAESVRSWSGLIEYASEVQAPSQVIPPMSQLPVYSDGLLCRLDAARCCKLLRSIEAMRKHWREVHSWSVASKGGRPSQVAQKDIQLRVGEGCWRVHCQRLFVQGPGSQYFEVQPPSKDGEDPSTVAMDGEAAWAHVGEEMARVGQRREAGARHDPGGQARQGEPVGRADAVTAVLGGHGAGGVDGVYRGARG
jgi:hypothetical protein